jgi:hypothetical protein
MPIDRLARLRADLEELLTTSTGTQWVAPGRPKG